MVSGVDHAIGIRNKYFKDTDMLITYYFTDIPYDKYVQRYVDLGIDVEQMQSVHFALAGKKDLSGNYPVEKKLGELTERFEIDEVIQREEQCDLYKNRKRIASIFYKRNREYLTEVKYYESERLIASEYYLDRLIYRDYFVTIREGNRVYAKKCRTTFYDKFERAVYDCIYQPDGKKKFAFPDGRFLSGQELIGIHIRNMKLSKEDIIFIDRPSYFDFVQPLFEYGDAAKKIVFLHSGHFFEKGEEPESIYMNYEYYGWFKYSHKIDRILVSTEEQKSELYDKLLEYNCKIPKLNAIVIGGLHRIRYPEMDRKRYSLITVSRHDRRKHLDFIIRCVIKAHERLSGVTLDIYGGETVTDTPELKRIVIDNNAQSYIRFRGYMDVREKYREYEMYITASTWETLGLSVMEAIGSGNAIVGLDARYGNRLFIENDKNGRLIAFKPEYILDDKMHEKIIADMADAVVDILSDDKILKQYQEQSYQIAKQFTDDKIEGQWLELLEEIMRG